MNFELLNRLAYEYVLMVDVLRKKYSENIVECENRIYLDKELFDELLSKKDFLSVIDKKKYWRSLGWISCDTDRYRYTKKIRLKDKTFRKIVIEKEPYITIKKLIKNE